MEEAKDEIDSEFFDSDYDVEDGDDDMFAANIDRQVHDHNEPFEIVETEDDVGLVEDDLHLSKEQEEELKYKFKVFNAEVDMEQPDFKVGMVFADARELREALKYYSAKERVKIQKFRNETARLDVVCLGECPGGVCSWFLKVSEENRKEAVVVRKYRGTHRCERV
jgi:hypothetical protein